MLIYASVYEIINRSKLGNHGNITVVSVLLLGFGLGINRSRCDRREISGLLVGVVDALSLLAFFAA